jgi:Sulfotransferase family
MSSPFAARDELVARAVRSAGCEDFGQDSGWEEGLDRLIAALEGQEYLPGAVDRIEARLTGALAGRLRVEQWVAAHPGATSSAIEGPVIIIGLPRTATTALLNLLSCDARWRYVRAWESEEPIPPPDIETEGDDRRAVAERDRLASDTTFAGMHIHEAGGPVDDAALLRLSFRNQELGLPAFEYTRWWRDCDMRATYAYHHRMLRLLQHRRPPHRWLIKAPWHNFHLDELLDEYPDARFLMTHRDPARTIPSVCNLVYTAFSTYQPPAAIDPSVLGRFLFGHLQISIARLMDFRDRIGPDRFIDIHHSAFNHDPLRVVQCIYDWLDAPLTPEARAQMAAWSERHRAGSGPDRKYEAGDFGLSSDAITSAFLSYISRHQID